MQWNPELYNDKHAFVFDYGAALLELLAPQADERILDLGCGTGELTHRISQAGARVTGLDRSPAMIRRARADYPKVAFEVGDASTYRSTRPYDAIFSNATLHWVTAYEAAAVSMYANLRPGGRLVVEFGGQGNVAAIVGALRHQLSDRGYTRAAAADPWYFPSVGAYARVLERAGFRVTYAVHYDRPTPLADNHDGIVDWIKMFGAHFFVDVPDSEVDAIARAAQEALRPRLFTDGKWIADYKRIRIVAVREEPEINGLVRHGQKEDG